MRAFFILSLLSINTVLLAQTDSLYVSTQVKNTIYAIDFNAAKAKFFEFVAKNNIEIENQNESKTDVEVKFSLNQGQYKSYDSLIGSLGYSAYKNVNTVNNNTRVAEIKLELAYLKQKKESYSELLQKLDEKAANYLTLWNEQKTLEENIFNKEKELIAYNKKENNYHVDLDLNEERTSPENTKVSFVNMPGLEYSVLNIESPQSGISARNYQGYFLKYLFTKGKSYGTIGVYKSNQLAKSDSTAYSDMFVLGFGQDFYSRHLGRGSRKCFNLYSGYSIGGIAATGKTSSSTLFYISPSVGLELFKNRYFLLDTKVNYFLPLSNNRYLRGISYCASFNFVF